MSAASRRAAGLDFGSALLLTALALAPISRVRASADPATVPTLDSLATLAPFEAYQRARALGEAGRFAASLPYFRRALEVPPRSWRPYGDYAISLFQTTHQVETRRGFTRPVVRSSFERVAMMREALDTLERAGGLAGAPADRAFLLGLRARYLAVWGLSWDALTDYTRAGADDRARLDDAARMLRELREPTRYGPRLSAEPDAGDGE